MPTNIQGWLRDHSEKLAISFRSSGRIEHKVTKGESREHQILDTLSELLPTKSSVESNIVIVDSTDTQSPKFDGGLIDRTLWPRIFVDGSTAVVMIESVLAAIEVKSSLDKSEVDDIFNKSAKLRRMKSGLSKPLVTAFAYDCPNPNLSFFDFSASFASSPDSSPSLICILNQHLFGLARLESGRLVPEDNPSMGTLPVLYTPREDTLLIYLHFLSQWVTSGTSAANSFMRYSRNAFARMDAEHFEEDFLNAIRSDEKMRAAARECFKRSGDKEFTDLYKRARKAIGI